MSDWYIPGLVHPREYNWKKQWQRTRDILLKKPQAFVEVDSGKLMGLLRYIEELEGGDGR